MSDRVFRGLREVVLLDGEFTFREIPSPAPRRVFLHGSLCDGDPSDLASRRSFDDLFGRFVVIVHDPERRTVEVHGDRYGFVPFHRATSADGRLHLSTRIRPLVARGVVAGEADPETLADQSAFHLALGPRTLVEGVETLEAGRSLRIDLDTLAVSESRPWDPAERLREGGRPFEEARADLVELFLEATRRSVGGETGAVTLSGGMDTRCLLAALLHLRLPAVAWHVSVPGSRAERYARRIAEVADVPLRALVLDAGFGPRYRGLLERVVEATEGMKLVPQPEMLWLRDSVDLPAVVLHGAFGEIAKLRVLRDYRLDEAILAAGRRGLEGALWSRFEDRCRSHVRIFSPELRARLEERARAHLAAKLETIAPDLGVAEALQALYFDEFVKSARYGHQLWNERVPTRFPFMEPRFVDRLLEVRSADRMEQRFQKAFLEDVRPDLLQLPDENTGTRAEAGPLWEKAVRAIDLARIALFNSKVEANHGDLVDWIERMDPPPEEVVAEAAADPIYDRSALSAMVDSVRKSQARAGPLRVASLRRARRDALALQTFFLVEMGRRWLAAARSEARAVSASR